MGRLQYDSVLGSRRRLRSVKSNGGNMKDESGAREGNQTPLRRPLLGFCLCCSSLFLSSGTYECRSEYCLSSSQVIFCVFLSLTSGTENSANSERHCVIYCAHTQNSVGHSVFLPMALKLRNGITRCAMLQSFKVCLC